MLFTQTRHNIYTAFIIMFIFFSCMAVTLWKPWVFMTFITFILLMIDLIFLSQEEYANSYAYVHWKQLDTYKIHEFEFVASSRNAKMNYNQ